MPLPRLGLFVSANVINLVFPLSPSLSSIYFCISSQKKRKKKSPLKDTNTKNLFLFYFINKTELTLYNGKHR